MASQRLFKRSWQRTTRLTPLTAHLHSRAVTLRPGARMDWHTTGAREELLIIVEGGVVVETRMTRRRRRTPLAAGGTLFLPPQCEHQVLQAGRRAARYIYVTG